MPQQDNPAHDPTIAQPAVPAIEKEKEVRYMSLFTQSEAFRPWASLYPPPPPPSRGILPHGNLWIPWPSKYTV